MFTSDWHLSHANLHKFGHRDISSVDDNYEFLAEHYNGTKRDHVIFCGDMIMADYDRALAFIDKLPAKKKTLIVGNHDWERTKIDLRKVIDVFDDIGGIRSMKGTWVSHAPIHPCELDRRWLNIHGHLHDPTYEPTLPVTNDPRYFNVNVDELYPKYGEIMLEFNFIKDVARADIAKWKEENDPEV